MVRQTPLLTVYGVIGGDPLPLTTGHWGLSALSFSHLGLIHRDGCSQMPQSFTGSGSLP